MNPVRSIDDIEIGMIVQVDLRGRHKPKRGCVTGKTETHALVKFDGKKSPAEIPLTIQWRRSRYDWVTSTTMTMHVVTAHDEWLERCPQGDGTAQNGNRGRDIVVNCAAFTA